MTTITAISERDLDQFLDEEFEPQGLDYIDEVMGEDENEEDDKGSIRLFSGRPGNNRLRSRRRTKAYFRKQKSGLKKTIRETVCKLAISILPDEDYLKELATKLTDALIKVIPIGIDIILKLLRKLFEKAVLKVLQWLLGILQSGTSKICDGVDEESPSPLAPQFG